MSNSANTAATKETFTVKTSRGYALRFLASMQLVQCTGEQSAAKQFASRKSAQSFIDKYADAGYALASNDATIVSSL